MQNITWARVKTFDAGNGEVIRFAGAGGRWAPIDGRSCTYAVAKVLGIRGPSYRLEQLRAEFGPELETL